MSNPKQKEKQNTGSWIDYNGHQQQTDDDLINARLTRQFEDELNGIVLIDAALIKSEQTKGDHTHEI